MINKIIPFKGICFNKKLFKSPDVFTCWPYDVINKKQQDMFYKKGQYNIIRVTLGKEKASDTPKDDKYTRAKKYFNDWLKKNILVQDEEPGFYIYEQIYKIPYSGNEKKTITGFIGLIKLQDYQEKKIIPHEDVLKKPLADRFHLVKATHAQTCAIYGLYEDEKNNIDEILENYKKTHKPEYNYQENHSVTHRFWTLNDSALIERIQKVINSKKIYIADGHHRYHTMLNYRNYYKEKHNIPNNVEHSVDYIMMYLVNSSHQGLSVLPYHRILYNLKEMKLKKLLEHIKDYFHLKVFTFNNEVEERKERERLLYFLKTTPSNEHSFGIYIKKLKRFFLLTLKNQEAYLEMGDINHSKIWKTLEVSIIHTLLIDHILQLSYKDISEQVYIDYTKDYMEALEKVKKDKHQVAIIVNPTRVDQILQIAKLSEKMPQKSTYFYPKISTGFVMYKMDK